VIATGATIATLTTETTLATKATLACLCTTNINQQTPDKTARQNSTSSENIS